MTIRYTDEVRNAGLDGRVTAIGPAPTLRLFDASGKLLVEMSLPKEWMSKAANGLINKKGIWQGPARTKGEAKSYSISNKSGSAALKGEIPFDMVIDNPKFEESQNVVVGTFVIAAGNAWDE